MSYAVGRLVRQSPGWPTGAVRARSVGELRRYDLVDGGAYRVAGTVAIDGTPATPVARRVRLIDKLTGRLVRECWSEAGTGAFVFTGLKNQEYIVLTHDHTRFYNAVVADAVVPVL